MKKLILILVLLLAGCVTCPEIPDYVASQGIIIMPNSQENLRREVREIEQLEMQKEQIKIQQQQLKK